MQDNHDLLVIKRWLPNYFEDMLWSHIKQKIHDVQGVSEPEPVHYMPTSFQVRKTLDKRVHACEYPGCDKLHADFILDIHTDIAQVFTHIEHH